MGRRRDFKQGNDMSDSSSSKSLWLWWDANLGEDPRAWVGAGIHCVGRGEGTSDRGGSTESRQEKDPGGRTRKQADSRLRSEGRCKERFPDFCKSS